MIFTFQLEDFGWGYGTNSRFSLSLNNRYEDIIGPSVLAVSVMLSIVAQFSIKLYQILNGH